MAGARPPSISSGLVVYVSQKPVPPINAGVLNAVLQDAVGPLSNTERAKRTWVVCPTYVPLAHALMHMVSSDKC